MHLRNSIQSSEFPHKADILSQGSQTKALHRDVKKWREVSKDFGSEIAPVVNQALQETIDELRQDRANNGSMNSFKTDLLVIDKVFTQLGDSKNLLALQPFARYTQTVLQEHAGQGQLLLKQLSTLENNPITSHLNSFINHLEDTAGQITKLWQPLEMLHKLGNIQDAGISSIENRIGSVINSLIPQIGNNIKTLFTGSQNFSPELKDVTNIAGALLQQVLNISGLDVTHQKTINLLEKDLNQIRNQVNPDKMLLLSKEFALQEVIHSHNLTLSDMQNTLNTVDNALSFLPKLFGLTNNLELVHFAQNLSIIGKSSVDIVKNIVSFGAIAIASGPLAPFVAIGGAIVTIFNAIGNLFGGKSDSELMMEQLNKLAQHLDQRFDRVETVIGLLHKHMHKRFDRLEMLAGEMNKQMHNRFNHIESMLGVMNTQMHGRFDRLENILQQMNKQMHGRFDRLEDTLQQRFNILETMLGKLYTDAMRYFIQLGQGLNTLQSSIDNINQQLANVERKIEDGFEELYRQTYLSVQKEALQYHKIFPYPDYKLTPTKLEKFYLRFGDWAIEGAKNKLLAGSVYDDLDEITLVKEVQSRGIEYKINLVAKYASSFGIQTPSNLANPLIWADGARAFMNFIEQTPEFKLIPQHKKTVEDIMKVGEQINKFILDMKTSNHLFSSLCENYRNSINAILEIITNFIFTAEKKNSEKYTSQLKKMLTNRGSNLLSEEQIHKFSLQQKEAEHYRQLTMRSLNSGDLFHNYDLNLPRWNGLICSLDHDDLALSFIMSAEITSARSEKRSINLEKLTSYSESGRHLAINDEITKVLNQDSLDQTLNLALKKLETAYQLLNLFIELTFKNDCQKDEIFNLVKNVLWSSLDFYNYFKWSCGFNQLTHQYQEDFYDDKYYFKELNNTLQQGHSINSGIYELPDSGNGWYGNGFTYIPRLMMIFENFDNFDHDIFLPRVKKLLDEYHANPNVKCLRYTWNDQKTPLLEAFNMFINKKKYTPEQTMILRDSIELLLAHGAIDENNHIRLRAEQENLSEIIELLDKYQDMPKPPFEPIPEFIALTMQKQVLGAIDRLEILLLEKIMLSKHEIEQENQKSQEEKSTISIDPLVDTVLSELQAFKEIYFEQKKINSKGFSFSNVGNFQSSLFQQASQSTITNTNKHKDETSKLHPMPGTLPLN